MAFYALYPNIRYTRCPLYFMVGLMVPYNVSEDSDWGLEIFEVKRCLEEARVAGLTIRAMVIINPG